MVISKKIKLTIECEKCKKTETEECNGVIILGKSGKEDFSIVHHLTSDEIMKMLLDAIWSTYGYATDHSETDGEV